MIDVHHIFSVDSTSDGGGSGGVNVLHYISNTFLKSTAVLIVLFTIITKTALQ